MLTSIVALSPLSCSIFARIYELEVLKEAQPNDSTSGSIKVSLVAKVTRDDEFERKLIYEFPPKTAIIYLIRDAITSTRTSRSFVAE